MLIGVIADDFTGAGDIANTLAKGLPGEGGLKVSQFMGVPDEDAPADIEAGVVSLKSRSIPAAEAVAQSLAALAWLQAQGCRQIVFKYCSTFDSTPEGNIGPVGEALANALGVKGVVACPAFPTVGRTVHQGHLFVHDRLLSESGMENHPLTPMTDPDLRRWLARQCQAPVGLVAAPIVRRGPEAIKDALRQAGGRGEILVIADAATDDDLVTLGKALADAPLLTGGSGIAIGLPANFIAKGLAQGRTPSPVAIAGPGAILAGSCSRATLGQIEHHAKDHPAVAIAVGDVMSGAVTVETLCDFLLDSSDPAPLAYSSGKPEDVAAAQAQFGREEVAEKLDALFAGTAKALVAKGVTRLVVAGGETSGAVAQALDLGALTVGPEIDPGVPILTGERRRVALALKSGNFGGPDFFARALSALAGDAPR
ncbi:3-oxo-tetronate kinase [Aurantimonas sp. HBX-1]|uniref:3-oxo-tetronate kinase n=1 Tax=Aurantimonas sp. HBX-1 TaxID=2906072 RepID=UPI001F1F76A4|nr:3-oxo-tetronate kinase [Aurantimonas sp. HBX-1]UIJ70693.1 four-carbon acid sugar kinase family protein [Aurantimonas sp. HBX-1]